jgi:hypothetical protein
VTQPEWVATPYAPVHTRPADADQYQWEQLPQEQVRGMSRRMNESFLQNVVLALRGLFVPTGQVGAAADQISEWATAQTEAIANLEEIIAAVNTTPAYVSDLDDMATVPRFAVSTVALQTSSTPPKYTDILDYMQVNGGSIARLHYRITPTILPEVTLFSSLGHIYYTPIVADRIGIVEKIRWIVGSDTSIFSIDYYEVALCVYNPATGNIEKVWGSGNIKDAEADVGNPGTPPAEALITMLVAGLPINQQCTPGQVLFFAHQQTAPGGLQSPRRLAVAPVPNMDRNVPLLDAWCYVAEDHTQGIPSSISLASLTRENRFIPYGAVTVSAVPPS